MVRIGEELRNRSLLHLAAGVHHHDPVRGLRDHPEIVRDQDDAHAEALLEIADERENLGLDRHVERGRRLVRDEDHRVAYEGGRDHDPLAHAARELVRKAPRPPFGVRHPHPLEHLDGMPARRPRRQAEMAASHLRDLLADRHHRIERGHRLLNNHPDVAPPDLAEVPDGKREEVVAPEPRGPRDDFRGRARRHADEGEGEHRLAAAGLADDAEGLPGGDLEAHVADHARRAPREMEDRRQPLDGEQARGAVPPGGLPVRHRSSPPIRIRLTPGRAGGAFAAQAAAASRSPTM